MISLPLYPSLAMEQIHYITDCVKQIVASHTKREVVAAGAISSSPAVS
jgi:hypothetical protein